MRDSEVRESVRESVETVLWLDRITNEDQQYAESLAAVSVASDNTSLPRCMICTLPVGTCEHTTEWIFDHQTHASLGKDYKSALDKEIDDALDVLSQDVLPSIDREVDTGEADLQNMRWATLDVLLTDKIGKDEFSLYSPGDRLWHTTVNIEDKFLLVFGGMRYHGSGPFRPFMASVTTGDIEVLDDLRCFESARRKWTGMSGKGFTRPVNSSLTSPDPFVMSAKFPFPRARYGHCAAALSCHRMIVLGGRDRNGAVLNDVWIYSLLLNMWTNVLINDKLPAPSPRFHAACAADPTDLHQERVFLFGGTDGRDCFGDLWSFRAPPSENEKRVDLQESENITAETVELREAITTELLARVIVTDPATYCWTRQLCVGLPPCPRYGHQMLVLRHNRDSKIATLRDSVNEERLIDADSQLLVLGGIAVSAMSELSGSGIDEQDAMTLMQASATLSEAFRNENTSTVLGTAALSNCLSNDSESESLTQSIRRAERLRGTLFEREKETRIAEQEMVDAFKIAQSKLKWNARKARHPFSHLDVCSLHVRSMSWHSPAQQFPRLLGNQPTARAFFAACAIGNHILLLGGAQPTSLTLLPADANQNGGLYLYDTKRHRWSLPQPVNSSEYLASCLRLAQADCVRAKDRLNSERLRALSLGAACGESRESMLAEAELKVVQWRLAALQREKEDAPQSPVAHFGSTFTALRQRAVLCGGMGRQPQVMVLELECEREKQRRLQEEFYAKLEKDSIAAKSKEAMEQLLSIHQLREKALKELQDRERELRQMAGQDALSALPPLSIPKSVSLLRANSHTLWLSWSRPTTDTRGQRLRREDVTFFLYVQTSVDNLLQGDRVLVIEQSKALQQSRMPDSEREQAARMAPTDAQLSQCFASTTRRHRAEIVRVRGGGVFDVLFDDGIRESCVARWRLSLDRNAYRVLQSTSMSLTTEMDTSTHESVENLQRLLDNDSLSQSVRMRVKSKIAMKNKRRLSITQFHNSAVANKQPMPLRGDDDGMRSRTGSFDGSALSAISVEDDNPFSHNGEAFTVSDLNFNSPPTPTVVADDCWRLVYVGRDTHYALTGVLPRTVRDLEPHARAAVNVCVQTLGVDSPSYERSLLSKPSVFFTQLSGDDESIRVSEVASTEASLPPPVDGEGKTEQMSRVRRELVSAVVAGQIVSLERRANAVLAEGYGEDFA